MRSVHMERTKVVLSTTFWKCGSRLDTGRPLCPHVLRPVQRAALDLERRGLAIVLLKHGLGIEHIDGAGPAAYVDKDDVFRLRGEVRLARLQVKGAAFGGECSVP